MSSSDLSCREHCWAGKKYERQAYAAEILLVIEAQDLRPLRVSDDVWQAIQEGNAEAERGEFVSDSEMAAFYKRHGL